jgi:hypothetical protein
MASTLLRIAMTPHRLHALHNRDSARDLGARDSPRAGSSHGAGLAALRVVLSLPASCNLRRRVHAGFSSANWTALSSSANALPVPLMQ